MLCMYAAPLSDDHDAGIMCNPLKMCIYIIKARQRDNMSLVIP